MFRKVFAIVVGGLCTYEVVALSTGKVPTITRLCWNVRGTTAGRVAIWGAGGVLMYHLLVEEDAVQSVVDAVVEALP
jgi:hypothetical protein